MTNAAILSIGTEIMKGKIENTNASFISRWLKNIGINTKYHISVHDIISDVKKSIEDVSGCNLIILTGGLGPTDDDLTREAVSEYLNKKLIFNEESWIEINNIFKSRNFPIYESNKKQAMVIEGGETIKNKRGTAPGIFYNHNGKLFFLLPGPPNENQPMLDGFVYNKLSENNLLKGKIYSQEIRVYNSGESKIADLFKNLKTSCDIGYYFSQEGHLEIIVSKLGDDNVQIKNEVDGFFKKILKILNDNNIFYTDNREISEILLEHLLAKKLTITFAESITGGAVAANLVKTPDASKVLTGSIVAYSNETKKMLLGVSEDTLNEYGAVSEECIKEMAYGLKKIINADICISISGIAGPSGGSKDKPVGLVYFGFLVNNEYFSKKEIFLGNRGRIISRSINFAFVEILGKIKAL